MLDLLEGALWLAKGSWHDAPRSDKVLLPDFVGHTHTHTNTHAHTHTHTHHLLQAHRQCKGQTFTSHDSETRERNAS